MLGQKFVSILVPVLNEERYLEDTIMSLFPSGSDLDFEILILDGGSSDGTVAIAKNLESRDGRIKLLRNEKRLQSSGVNLGATRADARASVFVRADCHAVYPPGFVRRALEELERTGAKSVVVPMRATGRTCLQRAIAAAQNAVIGTGGSPHRSRTASRFIDHGHHAAFDRSTFLRLGGYDETFSHNEDAEFDLRLIRSGEKVWLDARNVVTYLPRPTLGALARQYFDYGRGRARTILKHAQKPKLRQILPVLILSTNVIAFVLGLLVHWAWFGWIGSYAGATLLAGLLSAIALRDWCAAASGFAAMVMHQGWGLGFLSVLSARALRWIGATVWTNMLSWMQQIRRGASLGGVCRSRNWLHVSAPAWTEQGDTPLRRSASGVERVRDKF